MKIINPAITEDSRNHYLNVEAYLMKDGKVYNFSRWNGEEWGEWWEDGNADNCGRYARPIYCEGEYDGDFDLVGIEF